MTNIEFILWCLIGFITVIIWHIFENKNLKLKNIFVSIVFSITGIIPLIIIFILIVCIICDKLESSKIMNIEIIRKKDNNNV